MDSRSSHMYLQVWCGVLTVAMVVMAALLISIHPKLTDGEVSTLKPDNVSPTGPTVNSNVAPHGSIGSTPLYIQLIKFHHNDSWQESTPSCRSRSLFLSNESIHFKERSTYFIYAQVNFGKHLGKGQRSVTLKRNPTNGRGERVLVEGTFPEMTVGSVWVSKIVSLSEGDSVSLEITEEFEKDSELTFWGAFQLH